MILIFFNRVKTITPLHVLLFQPPKSYTKNENNLKTRLNTLIFNDIFFTEKEHTNSFKSML